MPKAAPAPELTPEQIDAINAWHQEKKGLDAAKTAEIGYRLKAIEALPFDPSKIEGGQTLALNAGWRIALTRTINYGVEKDTQKIMECLNKIGANNPGLAAELITWEPKLSLEAYKRLTEDERKIMSIVVTMKPGTPALELKPPAAKKE